jgi:hypothetical protein
MSVNRVFPQQEIEPLPAEEVPELPADGFVLFPLDLPQPGGMPTAWCHEIYRLAYEQAQDAVRAAWFQQLYAVSLN